MKLIEPYTTTHDSIPAKTGKNDADRTSGDCISRQAMLETIRTMQTYKLFSGDDMILIDKAEVQTELMMLPSAQPEQRWIPVTERLPEVGKGVLLTTTFPTVIIGWLKSDGKWLIYENDGNSFQGYITAWMPLPEPYQERGEQK